MYVCMYVCMYVIYDKKSLHMDSHVYVFSFAICRPFALYMSVCCHINGKRDPIRRQRRPTYIAKKAYIW